MRPLFRVLFSVEHEGRERVPTEGAVIIAGNHPSYLDPVLVWLGVERRMRFMAWDALFRAPVLGWVIRSAGAFPVDIRKGHGEAAFREAMRVLGEGEVLGIFPEGQRSEEAAMGELRTGVARLAIGTGAAIVPVTIGGASRAWPKTRRLPRSAKIVVRYHEPIRLEAAECAARGEEREFHQEVMARVAASINRSLKPAIRGADSIEGWYRQPPSSVRSYEWGPLAAALIAFWVGAGRGRVGAHGLPVALIALGYYLYLAADLCWIPPSRAAKWARNSMPIWLILLWHLPLARLAELPAGDRNPWLAASVLAAFFPFFYEDYFTVQKFVRGVVTSYYVSLALQLWRPHGLGTLVAVLGFVALFALWFRVIFRGWIAAAMIAIIGGAIAWRSSPALPSWVYPALSAATILYLQSFISIAYDIRRAGNVAPGPPPG
ncbi:MAG: lysophospholipid acyltransferase family protein [Blastocatellia bacterium]|nr:lysophospholipid acyltransferase family protein [Blastocatellia bacterium]